MALQSDAFQAPWSSAHSRGPLGASPSAPSTSYLSKPSAGLSIIIPTRNEAGNIATLVHRLDQALSATPIQILFVDDSEDETPQVIEQVRQATTREVLLLHRPPSERGDGLGGAVVLGMRVARYPWVCVMDADLQHPPEVIPNLIAEAEVQSVDMVMASRLSQTSDASSLGFLRRQISYSMTYAAHALFPKRLKTVTDPLTGFFLLRRSAIRFDALRPNGFKILLEILVRFPFLRWSEIPFHFGKRLSGESKASAREVGRYLSLITNLRFGIDLGRFVRFMAVGTTGIGVNLGLQALAAAVLGFHYLVAATIATQGSSLWNYLLTDYWVFGDRRDPEGQVVRLVQFFLLNNVALLLRGPIMYGLTSKLNVHYLLSNLISILVLMILRYALSDRIIWSQKPATSSAGQAPTNGARANATDLPLDERKPMSFPFHYNIHGIITVSSEAWLPELDAFEVAGPIESPAIIVRVDGRFGNDPAAPLGQRAATQITYVESLGRLGFEAEIIRGDVIEIIASPLLRYSPHVLYTNLVEPVLRWTFVEKGYALIHGACVAFGERAYLVTARTDTGKTTTILNILDRQRRASDEGAFISDDLTLVSPDGHVMTYPKPLTISAHTLRAVHTPQLKWRQRLTLPLQSRLHSRAGRRFALLLARSHLPMATINTIVQMVVPPPKYHVQQLVPSVKLAHHARLAGLFVIERGGHGSEPLSEEMAIEIVLQNCEDAYGFPPYEQIAGFLYGRDQRDLREEEKRIITQALRNCSAQRLLSDRYDWWRHILYAVGDHSRRVAPVPDLAVA